MNRKPQRTHKLARCARALTMLLVVNGALSIPAYSGSCDTDIAALKTWLSNPTHIMKAVIASHRAAPLPGMQSEVTYSQIMLKLNGFGWLVTDTAYQNGFSEHYRKQFYDTRLWHYPPPPGDLFYTEYPFSPDKTDSISITIMPSGDVRVYPQNGKVTHSFNALCSGGVMYGMPAVTGLLSPTPMYTITFDGRDLGPTPPPPPS